jgi:subtilisin family serine protease
MNFRYKTLAIGVIASFIYFFVSPEWAVPGSRTQTGQTRRYVAGELLVKYKPRLRAAASEYFRGRWGVSTLKTYQAVGAEHVKLPKGMTVEEAMEIYRDDPDVEYAEPNYYRHATATPDDTFFDELWGLHNTGQVVSGSSGTPDADIDAPGAWDTQKGSSSVVVAVLDTGVDWDHEDLSDNMWTNSDEGIGDANGDGFPGVQGVDDDGDGLVDEDFQGREPGDLGYTNDLKDDDDENGYIDDIRGWDFVNENDNNPDDDNDSSYHGTHVSGTIGAKGNNEKGITGVNWSVSIMPLKILGVNGTGSVANEIEAIDFAIANGAKIINASFSGDDYSEAEYDAIERARDAGVLFVAAAGNGGDENVGPGWDNDVAGQEQYPASYDVTNIVAVAATDQNDALAGFSNYGATSVDVTAPGVDIYSTKADNEYQLLDGTSMATPHVSGLAALILAENGAFTYSQVKDRILNGVDVKTALSGKVLMAGRINANNSIKPGSVPDAPSGLGVGAASTSQTSLNWTDNADDESGFKIKRATVSGGPHSHIATVAADAESYTDTGLNDGTTYYYRVCAFNAAGNSTDSNEDEATTLLPAPSGLSATAASSSRVDLSWTDNSFAESGYNIEQKTGSGGTYAEIAVVDADVATYSNTGLSASTAYYYRVRAYNSSDNSDYSNEAHATTLGASGGDDGGGCFITTAAHGQRWVWFMCSS